MNWNKEIRRSAAKLREYRSLTHKEIQEQPIPIKAVSIIYRHKYKKVHKLTPLKHNLITLP